MWKNDKTLQKMIKLDDKTLPARFPNKSIGIVEKLPAMWKSLIIGYNDAAGDIMTYAINVNKG